MRPDDYIPADTEHNGEDAVAAFFGGKLHEIAGSLMIRDITRFKVCEGAFGIFKGGEFKGNITAYYIAALGRQKYRHLSPGIFESEADAMLCMSRLKKAQEEYLSKVEMELQ